ncbi:AP-4 complex subunit mu-1 like protein [Argiope bruennichi]|uniref:AP-4 complex subunit mu-1 like protein n=1 Tax=Argiope bruennichi TaxID=94029 RepID=A0A8T0EMS2_ARGBR|nr:AP-4 complex subunit mu-1 like protein [Argiope bruennichi]
MLSAFYIFSSRGDVLLKEKYRDDIPEEYFNSVISSVLKSKSGSNPPCVKSNGIQGFFIKRDKITYVALSKREIPTLVVIQFLDSFHSLLRNFCGGATEDHITKNLLLVYELLTECVDNGFMKTTNTEQIRHTVYADPVVTKSNPKYEVKKPGPVRFGLEKVLVPNSAAERPLVKSRSQQLIKTAEVFVDVFEKLTAHFNKEGQIQIFHLYGCIQLKSFINHSHQLLVSLEDSLKQETLKGLYFDHSEFDTCVDYKNFEKNRSFIARPSQGEIKAMSYTLENPVLLPFRLTANILGSEQNRDCDLILKLNCNLPTDVEALNISLHIPVSSATRNIMQQFSKFQNSAEFIRKERKIIWRLKKLPGQEEVIAKFKLIEALQVPANYLEMGPVSLEFEASNTTCSGLRIRNIKAEDPSGKPILIQKWVRYVTVAQSYVFQI